MALHQAASDAARIQPLTPRERDVPELHCSPRIPNGRSRISGMPPVDCPRCGELRETYTVPLRLPGGAEYQHLCANCYREVTGEEPTESQAIRPVTHGRR
jgi:DNA-directed RNA polymerase subunit RPC12/RpoP